jgi:hypothetical protein
VHQLHAQSDLDRFEATGGLDVGDGAATVVNPVLNLLLIPLTAARNDNSANGAALVFVETEVLIAAFGVATVGTPSSTAVRSARALGDRVGRALGDGVRDPAVPAGGVARRGRPSVRRECGCVVSPTPEEAAFLRSCARRASART